MYLELCILFLTVFLAVHWAQWHGFIGEEKNLPPGYYGFPVIGVVPFILWNRNYIAQAKNICKKSGPIFRVRVGWVDVVVVNGSTGVKEALKNDDLLGRPKNAMFNRLQELIKADPFVTMEGPRWKAIRNYSVHTLRDLGFGKTLLIEKRIQEEIGYFLDVIGRTQGIPYEPRNTLLASVSNNIATLVFGDRHPRWKSFNKFLLGFIETTSYLFIFSFVPLLMKLMTFIGIKQVKKLLEFASIADTAFTAEVESHAENFDGGYKRDFLDHLLAKQKEDPELYTSRVVRGTCFVFFAAGSNTTRVSIEYLLQLCAAYPHLQEQMFQEIIHVVGDARLPSWVDKDKLHLVNAFIQERHRIFSILPLGIFRRSLRDTKLCGYDIPKNTVVIYNIDSVHVDPTVFENPYEFNPSRFIDVGGRFIRSNAVIPFAIGKRACSGEAFATFETFLYFTTILQRFRIEAPKGADIKLATTDEFFSEPIQQSLVFISRS